MSEITKDPDSIFTGVKSYLEKSFLEELNYKIWSTKGARFEADKRLKIVSRTSNISLSILSAYLIIAGLISVYNLKSNLNFDFINYIVTALSIILLVLSLHENAQDYKLRANNFHNCSLELSTLYDRLRIFKTLTHEPTLEEKKDFAINLSNEYFLILSKYENHISIDYKNFQLNHKEYFTKISSKDELLITLKNQWIRYGWYTLLIFGVPALIIFVSILTIK
ncbi:SLATT domain-containing protein [uncultured Chryseobacterium sp.]|uniref:SLATT domain-containing protein n=1 Tax=uncultured Chryseobacterium sp. TaxID=259322 RepID=UPI003749175C